MAGFVSFTLMLSTNAAAAAVDRHARRRSDDQMVAEKRKGGRSLLNEYISTLPCSSCVTLLEQQWHTVKAAQVLPRRGDDHGQHDHKRQNHHQRPLEPAAGAARPPCERLSSSRVPFSSLRSFIEPFILIPSRHVQSARRHRRAG